MAISSGVLLPAVPENPTFPILSALAYTTGLGYRPTCDAGDVCWCAVTYGQLTRHIFIDQLTAIPAAHFCANATILNCL